MFLAIHVLFTLLYVLPDNMVPGSLKQKSNVYISSLFNQGWALFAPTPQVNKKVYASYLGKDKQWSAWQNPFKKYMEAHQQHRFTANQKIVLMQSSTLHYLWFENEELFQEKKIILGDTNSGYYKVLKHEVAQELLLQKKNFERIKLLVEYTDADCGNRQSHYIYYPD